MPIRWLAAALHLMALGFGPGAVWARGRALRAPLDRQGLQRVFYADNWWGIAAVVWIVTGLLRLFGGLEKGTAYYFGNRFFWIKMALLALVLVLEAGPMITLIRWRIKLGRGQVPDTSPALGMARISFIEAGLVILMVLAATAMARGYGGSAV
jgi:putative membrane protein